MQHMFEIGP